MPPTTVADETLRGQGSGRGGEVLLDLSVGLGVGHRWRGWIIIFAFVVFFFSPKENLPGPRPALTPRFQKPPEVKLRGKDVAVFLTWPGRAQLWRLPEGLEFGVSGFVHHDSHTRSDLGFLKSGG